MPLAADPQKCPQSLKIRWQSLCTHSIRPVTILASAPPQINDDPYGAGWMVKVKLTKPEQLNELLDSQGYSAFCDE